MQTVTVTLGKVPVTLAAGRKIALQAGMSRLMNDVRSYVRLHVTESRDYGRFSDERAEKGEKHP
jgi:hypothetical protein